MRNEKDLKQRKLREKRFFISFSKINWKLLFSWKGHEVFKVKYNCRIIYQSIIYKICQNDGELKECSLLKK